MNNGQWGMDNGKWTMSKAQVNYELLEQRVESHACVNYPES